LVKGLTVANVPGSQVKQYRVQTSTPDPIDFIASTPQGVSIDRGNPIMHIECMLEGSLVVGTAAATLKDGGCLNLINQLVLRVGGEKNVMRYRGKFAQFIHSLYTRHAPHITQPAVTVGTNAFKAFFRIPINAFTPDTIGVADYRSLLDPTKFGTSQITLEPTWAADATVVATAGGGGTVALSDDVQLTAKVVHSKTTQIRIPGGLGWPQYMLHLITGDVQPITATQERLAIKLEDRSVHQRLILATEQDGTLVDTILNSITVGAAESGYQTYDADWLQAKNAERYRFAALTTGMYVIDFNELGITEQMLSYDGPTEIRVWLNVTKPGTGTTHNLTFMQDRFVLPG
jgi:hypothetical protein